MVQYLHAACFSPVPSTWCKAIRRGYFATFPGLTEKLVQKHLPKSDATTKGHQNQSRKNVRSTKPKPNIIKIDTEQINDFDLQEKLEERTNEHFIALYDLQAVITGKRTLTSPVAFLSHPLVATTTS